MDPAPGRGAVYFAAISRPATVHLGTSEVKGQLEQSDDVVDMLF